MGTNQGRGPACGGASPLATILRPSGAVDTGVTLRHGRGEFLESIACEDDELALEVVVGWGTCSRTELLALVRHCLKYADIEVLYGDEVLTQPWQLDQLGHDPARPLESELDRMIVRMTDKGRATWPELG